MTRQRSAMGAAAVGKERRTIGSTRQTTARHFALRHLQRVSQLVMPLPTEVQIRSFQDDDTPSVIALWRDVLSDSAPHNDPAQIIRQKIEFERDLFYVAVMDSTVVGTVMGGYDGHRGWVYSLAVAPDCQRQGIASALMAHLERALMERGCLKINLQVRASNQGVVSFYEKLGYQVEERVSMGKRMYDSDARA